MFRYYIFSNHLVINFYGLFMAIGLILAILLLYKTSKLRPIDSNKLINFSLLMIIVGLCGTRIFYVIFHWPEFRGRSWLDMAAFWRGGLMFQGGPILAVLVALVTLRRFGLKVWPTADAIAPSLALGQGVGRIGCFFAGCCYGEATTLSNPLAVIFPVGSLAPHGAPLWPTQLMESAGLLLLFITLMMLLRKERYKRRPGLIAAFYLLGSGLLRFGVDFFRGDNRGELFFSVIPTTLTAIIIAFIGLILIFYLTANSRKTGYDC